MRVGVFPIGSFLVALLVFSTTYSMRAASEGGLRLYYVSDLLNSSSDTPIRYVSRWTMWFLLMGVLYLNVSDSLSYQDSVLVPYAYLVCILTGLQPSVFGGNDPSPLLFYAHSFSTGFVMVCSTYVLFRLGFKASAFFWFVVTIAYGPLYTARHLVDGFDYPKEMFVITEYLFFLHFALATTVWRKGL